MRLLGLRALESDRLLLRVWSDTDADFVLDMYSRWEVQRFIGRNLKAMPERSEAESAIARWRSLDHPTLGVWAVRHRHDGYLLGTLLLKSIPAFSDEQPRHLKLWPDVSG